MSDTKKLWKEFCNQLEISGEQVLESSLATNKLDKAEGIRYLTRLLRIGLEMHLENSNPEFPSFYQASHATAKIGADNPDNFYQNATISSSYKYKISGRKGTVPILSFGTKANRYAMDGTMASTGELDIRDVDCDSDGSFEIIASKDKVDGNWLPLEDDSTILIVRQTFFDRTKEEMAKVEINTIDKLNKPDPISLKEVSESLSNVSKFIKGTSGVFLDWSLLFKEQHKNSLSTTEQSMFSKAGGDPMIYYLHGWWELNDNQALKISCSIPDCIGWNFQINNIWMESLDYRNHNIHTNNLLAEKNTDGSVTIIVSKKPQKGNWLDTAAHKQGTMLWRWTGAENHPLPKVEIINV
ncbi:MAG: DUF1214 domain-containing protein [Hellea sp.]|nr:DUF1214 domain-containing protein [Hellea sp.]